MTNDVQTKANSQMTVEQASEKYNGGKKIIDFVGKKKIFFGISIAIIVLGIICNFIFGTTLDIQFSGGATLRFSYSGEIDQTELYNYIQNKTTDKITTSFSTDIMGNSGNNVSVQFSGNDAIETDIQQNLEADLQKQYPDNDFKCLESNSVDASMGFNFLLKCLTAVAIASVLMVLYVTFRFKKIGGLSAGVMALVALFHDIAMIYFLYVIFQMPIDSNFIAVVLMILGYSLNDTIVIYDRVREERKALGSKADAGLVFNLSCTKTIKRTIMTSVTTLSAIMIVYIVAIFFNISSVQSFALPMMIGVISGCYSSVCIAGPLWVMWQNHKKEKKALKKASK
ncbi:protein translocase subunit SecF [Ruminococcus sp.]|uniref:protein translocase subunit SecF n=1 Tax=Ruminococcus sp. TaxID=41978 RepID=UPI003F0FD46A